MEWVNRLQHAISRVVKTGKREHHEQTGTIVSNGSDVSQGRLVLAAAAAGALLLGASYLAIDKIHGASNWMRVYTNGSYVGMVPDNQKVMDDMRRVASGYQINLAFEGVHTHVADSYDWQRVAQLPTNAVAIRYNGKTLLYTATRTDAERVLQDVKNALTPKNLKFSDVKVQFAGTVQLATEQVPISSVFSPLAAVHYILAPSKVTLPGRSASLQYIAEQYTSNQTKMLAASTAGRLTSSTNSGNIASGTGAGDIAFETGAGNISSVAFGVVTSSTTRSAALVKSFKTSTPLMTVKAEVQVNKTVTLAYPVHYVSNVHMLTGQVKVTTPGKTGKAAEQLLVTYVNGKPAKEQVLSKKVLQAPREEVAYKGTNSGVASGPWIWPTDRYDITSGFGWRYLGGYHNFHPGKDVGVPIGSPVYATNNGVVLDAGWNSGGYGNWVRIDNGNGIETIYGHLSHVNVHAGQTVAKGDLLGLSGDTGESTGPHLHYEVRLNGTPIPPDKYM